MSIVVKDLTKIYGEQKAINQISFQIPKGQIVGFLGPNGAGKSTTMKILTGFIPQSSGSAFICDIDVKENPIEVKKRVGYLPESNPLYKEMYVKEYLHFAAKVHQISNPMQRVREMIGLTGLDIEQNKKIAQLSKGYKQRVGIAQAMIHNPEVLILDEPTSGLDPNQLVEIRNLIKSIGNEKTVLLSTHIMQEVEAMCERVIIINQGEIVADDNTNALKSNIQKTIVVAVEFKEEVNKNLLNNLLGVAKVEQNGKIFKIYSKDNKIDLRQQVFQFSVDNGYTILSLQQEEKDLESIFKTLTKK
jgi:ABC-2 type transport system ATP-binding protein